MKITSEEEKRQILTALGQMHTADVLGIASSAASIASFKLASPACLKDAAYKAACDAFIANLRVILKGSNAQT